MVLNRKYPKGVCRDDYIVYPLGVFVKGELDGVNVLVSFTAGSSRVWTWNTAVFAIRCMRLLSASRPNSLALKQWAWCRKLACIS